MVYFTRKNLEKTQPDPREPDPTHNGQRGIQRGERVIERGESGTREGPTRPKEPDPPLPTDREGFREDGERDLDGLERRTGGQGWVWRLSERGLVEWREGERGIKLLEVDDSPEIG